MKKYVVASCIALGGDYLGGRRSNIADGRFAGAGAYGSSTRTFRRGGGLVTGQIASLTSGSMTIQLENGNSQVVFYASSTRNGAECAPPNTLQVGTTVMVARANSDGSLTAQTIQALGTAGTGGGAPATAAITKSLRSSCGGLFGLSTGKKIA